MAVEKSSSYVKWIGPVPSHWAVKKLRDISHVVRGSSPRPAGDRTLFHGDYTPWITVLEVTKDDRVFLTETTDFLTEKGANQSRQLDRGTVVLSNSGATLGVPKILEISGCANDGIAAFLNLSEEVSTLFLYYYLASLTNVFREQIAPGLGQPNLNTDLIGDMDFPCPPTDEQEYIGSVLRSIDEAIESARAVNVQAQKLRTLMVQHLLTKGIGNKKFQETEFGPIPQHWTMQKVGDLCEFSSGRGFSHSDWSTQGLPIIRIQNLNGSADFNHYEGVPEPSWIVEPKELLFAWAGVKGVSFGPCIWPGPRGVLNQHIYRIRPTGHTVQHWLYAVLGDVTHRIESKAHGFKTSLVHVHKSDITDQVVAVPPRDEQLIIAQRIQEFETVEASQKTHLSQLISTKTALSQGLLSGSICVDGGLNS